MIEFLENYGAEILAAVFGLIGGTVSVKSIVSMVIANRNIKKMQQEQTEIIDAKLSALDNKVAITREGIIEAFKSAILGNDFKISINNQVDQKLNEWGNRIEALIKENEDLRTKLAIANTKILKYTAAFNKLTEEEQQEINSLLLKLNNSVVLDTDIIEEV